MASTSTESRDEQLARLIAEQDRDDRTYRSWALLECDLAPDDDPDRHVFASLIDHRHVDPAEVMEAAEECDLLDPAAASAYRRRTGSIVGPKLIGLAAIWQAEELSYASGPCPAHGPELPRGSTCLVCSASHAEPKSHPMARDTPSTRPVLKAARKGSKGSKGKPSRSGLDHGVVPGLAGGTGPARPSRAIAG